MSHRSATWTLACAATAGIAVAVAYSRARRVLVVAEADSKVVPAANVGATVTFTITAFLSNGDAGLQAPGSSAPGRTAPGRTAPGKRRANARTPYP